jgi:hypothetical protein
MNALSELWAKLAGSKEYRHALVASELKRGLPRQIRILRKQHGREWNQQRLALETGLTQGAISRAEDPDYGNLTLNNLLNIGKGLDVAFIGRFVPFSDFAKWHASLSHESQLEVPSFPDDIGLIGRKPVAAELAYSNVFHKTQPIETTGQGPQGRQEADNDIPISRGSMSVTPPPPQPRLDQLYAT